MMNNRIVPALVALVCLVAPSCVHAQTLTTPAAPVTAPQRAHRENPLREALLAANLTPDQETKIKAIQKQTSEATRALMNPTAGAPTTDRSAEREQIKALHEKEVTDIKALLTTDQLAKFQPVYDQGIAFALPLGRALTPLSLTDEEKAKVAPILTAAQAQMAELKSVPNTERASKYAALIDSLKGQIRPLLTSSQQTQLDTLTFARQRGGRGRGQITQ